MTTPESVYAELTALREQYDTLKVHAEFLAVQNRDLGLALDASETRNEKQAERHAASDKSAAETIVRLREDVSNAREDGGQAMERVRELERLLADARGSLELVIDAIRCA